MCNVFARVRNYFKPTDVYTSQRLMLFLLNFAGLLPLRIAESRNDNRLRLSKTGCVFAFLSLSVYMAGYSVLFIYHTPEMTERIYSKVLQRFLVTVQFVNRIILVIVLHCSSLCSTKELRACMQQIIKIDRKFDYIGVEMNYWKGFRFSIAMIVFQIAHFVLTVVMSQLMIDSLTKVDRNFVITGWANYVTHHTSLVCVSLVECFYACITYEICKRFEAMNEVSFAEL